MNVACFIVMLQVNYDVIYAMHYVQNIYSFYAIVIYAINSIQNLIRLAQLVEQ